MKFNAIAAAKVQKSESIAYAGGLRCVTGQKRQARTWEYHCRASGIFKGTRKREGGTSPWPVYSRADPAGEARAMACHESR